MFGDFLGKLLNSAQLLTRVISSKGLDGKRGEAACLKVCNGGYELSLHSLNDHSAKALYTTPLTIANLTAPHNAPMSE